MMERNEVQWLSESVRATLKVKWAPFSSRTHEAPHRPRHFNPGDHL
jgi:hypothetical protein